ncbi:MAG TPA: DUF3617 family protein [Allosphingosinicella sp.]|nr:DUF3617 family protein [Allosphingosinicella sp.]
MRGLIVIPSLLAAACSGGGGEENKAEPVAATMQAGQWEIASEVTAFRSTDQATPALKAAVGDKATAPGCIEAGKEGEPPAAMFAGTGYECSYKDKYIRSGRITATLDCERDALDGRIFMTVQGNYKGDSFEGTSDATSYLSGEGDFAMSSKISGRRTGATCAAPAEEEKDKAKAKAKAKAG